MFLFDKEFLQCWYCFCIHIFGTVIFKPDHKSVDIIYEYKSLMVHFSKSHRLCLEFTTRLIYFRLRRTFCPHSGLMNPWISPTLQKMGQPRVLKVPVVASMWTQTRTSEVRESLNAVYCRIHLKVPPAQYKLDVCCTVRKVNQCNRSRL